MKAWKLEHVLKECLKVLMLENERLTFSKSSQRSRIHAQNKVLNTSAGAPDARVNMNISGVEILAGGGTGIRCPGLAASVLEGRDIGFGGPRY